MSLMIIDPYRFGAAAAYDPATDLPGLVHWYDFSDESTVTKSAGTFTAINDKKGSANLGVTGGRAPLVSTQNGLQAAEMNGNKEIFTDSNVSAAFSNTDQPFTFIFSVQPSSLSHVHVCFSLSSAVNTQACYIARTLASPNVWNMFKRDSSGGNRNASSSGAPVTTEPRVLTYTSGGTTLDVYDGNTQIGSGLDINVGATGIGRLTIGNVKFGGTTGVDSLHGTIGEVLVSTQQLTGANITNAINYMTDKWT